MIHFVRRPSPTFIGATRSGHISQQLDAEQGPVILPYRLLAELGTYRQFGKFGDGVLVRILRVNTLAGLERNKGNKVRTAEELGISLKTLYNKLHQLNDGTLDRTG